MDSQKNSNNSEQQNKQAKFMPNLVLPNTGKRAKKSTKDDKGNKKMTAKKSNKKQNTISMPSDFLSEITFLGFYNDDDYYYSRNKKGIVKISKYESQKLRSILNPTTYTFLTHAASLLSDEDLDTIDRDNYKRYFEELNEDGVFYVDSVNFANTVTVLQRISQSHGIYKVKETYQQGIFKNGLDEIIVNSSSIYAVNRTMDGMYIKGDRVITNKDTGERVVYEDAGDLFVNVETPTATAAEVKQVVNAFNSFNFRNGDRDVDLALGWFAHSFFAGCLNWRTHLSLTGARGTGKSTLITFISKLLNEFALLADGATTEAGIRQVVKKGAKAVILDESEASGKKIAQNLNMLRSASSGAKLIRGTADQNGATYELKIAGLIAGIVPPVFNAADSSRFLQITLMPLKSNTKDELLEDEDLQKVLGLRIAKLLILNYFTILDINKAVRKILTAKGFDGRFCETNGIIIAFSYFLRKYLNNSLKLADYIDCFDFSQQIAMNEEKDEESLLDFIMSRSIEHYNTKGSQGKATLTILFEQYIQCMENGSERALEEAYLIEQSFLQYDMSIFKDVETDSFKLRIDANRKGFTKLLGDKANLDVLKVLTRHKNIASLKETSHVNRIRFKGSSILRSVSQILEVDLSAVYLNENDEDGYNMSYVPTSSASPSTGLTKQEEEMFDEIDRIAKEFVKEAEEEARKSKAMSEAIYIENLDDIWLKPLKEESKAKANNKSDNNNNADEFVDSIPF